MTVRALDAGGQMVPSDAGIDVRHTLPTEQTNVSVRLSQLHPAVKKLSFELNDKSGASDAFGAVSGVWLRILRADHREILGFRAPDFSGNITSLVLGDIYFHRDEWKFNPVGRGLK